MTNLRTSTYADVFREVLQPSGFLVAPDYLTRSLSKSIGLPPQYYLLWDNGVYDEIGRLAARIDPLAPNWMDKCEKLSSGLMSTSVWEKDRAATRSSYIGPEIPLAALAMRTGAQSDDLTRFRRRFRRINRLVAAQAVELMAIDDRPLLPVATAHDYDTAFDAGLAFSQSGINRASIGFGAFMSDDSFVREFRLAGRRQSTEMPLPARYIRTALVTRGFLDGHSSAGGSSIEHFHFLGLGSPLMVAVCGGGALARVGSASFDATSPIRDASEGLVYVSRPAPMKIRVNKIVSRLLSGELVSWSCPCGFCRNFLNAFPMDTSKLADRHHPAVSLASLKAGSELAERFKLFGFGGDRLAEAARVGHNHAVLQWIARRLSRNTDPWSVAVSAAESYLPRAGNASLRSAIELSVKILGE